MPRCEIGRFESAADYAGQLHEFSCSIRQTAQGPFAASLVCVDLPFARLIDARELSARVGTYSIPTGWRYVCFTPHENVSMVWNGETSSSTDFILAAPDAWLRQETIGPTHWGMIGIRERTLELYAGELLDGRTVPPFGAAILNVNSVTRRRLLMLHRRIVRTAETRPKIVCNFQSARAIEQELIEALITCLTCGQLRGLQNFPAGIHSL